MLKSALYYLKNAPNFPSNLFSADKFSLGKNISTFEEYTPLHENTGKESVDQS